MKWILVIGEKQRYRLALCLAILFANSLLAVYFIRLNATAADQSVKSLYQDRLVPAQDIAFVQERLYQNELLLQEHISATSPAAYAQIRRQINQNQAHTDSLIDRFAHTLLVEKEVQFLEKYRQYVHKHRLTQQHILKLSEQGLKQEATVLHRREGLSPFKQLTGMIHQLASLQTSVGQDLYDASHHKLLEVGLLTYLVIGLNLIVGLLAQVLLKWPQWSSHLPYKPSLN